MNLISRLGGGRNKQRRIFPLFSSVPNLFNSLIPPPSRSSKKIINNEKIKFTNEEWEEDVINVVKVTFIKKIHSHILFILYRLFNLFCLSFSVLSFCWERPALSLESGRFAQIILEESASPTSTHKSPQPWRIMMPQAETIPTTILMTKQRQSWLNFYDI